MDTQDTFNPEPDVKKLKKEKEREDREGEEESSEEEQKTPMQQLVDKIVERQREIEAQ